MINKVIFVRIILTPFGNPVIKMLEFNERFTANAQTFKLTQAIFFISSGMK